MSEPVILVPVEGPTGAGGVLPIARRLAALAKARLHMLDLSAPDRAGKPAEAILAAAAQTGAMLIVMGARSAGAGPDGPISETALAALGGATTPVVLVDPAKAAADWDLKRMLALHDGSPSVSRALAPAGELARQAGAELVVLQVASDACAEEAGSIAPPRYVDQVQHSWPGWSAEFLHRLASHCPLAGVSVRLALAHGAPADETLRVAAEEAADLIVLTMSDAPDAAALAAVLRDARCPILVTRAITAHRMRDGNSRRPAPEGR